ncbi:MAG: hypothetical protein ABL931_21295 [Usitatibacteraceae bacterium]
MSDVPIHVFAIGAIGVAAAWVAWREYAGNNRRDAVLLALFGGGVLSATAWIAHANFV